MNRIAILVADMPNLLPGGSAFRGFHLRHHAHQGEFHHDADLASRWEARLIGNVAWRKLLWLTWFPIFQALRPMRMERPRIVDRWFAANCLMSACVLCATAWWCGWIAVLYLAASAFFAIGLHPLGARWIQEHYTLDASQETFSYYGGLNTLALNVGYHNEHHDFSSVPWHRLPRIRAEAPEFYDGLVHYRSWSGLLFRFIVDRRYSLYSRLVRGAS